ncbi:unnamed protein product [Linum trigynum]|uniref:Dienelactone hydrolase domain-containing protein n=1 Tax=Linum trigynum TaxID=586398 RepID=A0AAV2GLH4_9ROSI
MSGTQCCENPPTLNSASGAGPGHLDKVAGLDSYVAGSPDSKSAIVFVSDIFGYDAPNLSKFADKAAAAGYYVVFPDFFYGDPYAVPGNAERTMQIWLQDHGPAKGFEDVKPATAIKSLKSKGVTAIGAIGFLLGWYDIRYYCS